jgi:putative endonuclease
MRVRQPAVYLLASKPKGTLYVGVTSNLVQRVWQHRENLLEGFTKRYGVHRLVWFELVDRMDVAIRREKQIKKWNRAWKIELIEKDNPAWRDLWPEIAGIPEPEKLDSRLRGNDE